MNESIEKEQPVIETKPEPIEVKDNVFSYLSVPIPPVNKSMADAVKTLNVIENYTGVRSSFMAMIINMESNFDAKAKAPTSSARGWFQFIDSTWKTMLARHAKEYGIPTDSKEELRFDVRINALMGAELIRENVRILESTLKREPTLAEIYMAHFLGSTVAKKFLLLSNDVVVANVLPKEANANKWVFYNGNKARTVAEVKDYISNRIEKTLIQVNKYFY